MSDTPINAEFVSISKERLEMLELLEKNLPCMIQSAIDNYKKDKLKLLHEKDKLDPTLVNERVKRYAKKHKDTINAKRREKRKEIKENKDKDSIISQNDSKNEIIDTIKEPVITINKTINDLTVRFDS